MSEKFEVYGQTTGGFLAHVIHADTAMEAEERFAAAHPGCQITATARPDGKNAPVWLRGNHHAARIKKY